MFSIRTYNQISNKGLDRFPRDRYRVGPEVAAPQGYILRSHRLHGATIPDSLLAVARAGAGVNNIPVADYSARGVVVFNTPGANANAVKELVLTGMLLASRDIFAGMNYVQGLTQIRDDAEMAALLEKEKSRFAGCEIQGRTLGVVGLGAIGAVVANMALELGMKVVGYDPALSVEAAWRLSSSVEKMDSLQSLLARTGLSMSDVKVVKNHNPFAVNDAIFARMLGYDWREMNRTGSSLVWGHPQGPTLTRVVIEALEEAVDLGGGRVLVFGCAAGDVGIAALLEVGDAPAH